MLHFLERGFVTLSELLTFTLTHIQAHVQTKTSNMLKYNICSAKLGNCIQHFLKQQWLKTPTTMKNGWLVVTNQYMTVQFPSALRGFSIFQLADLASTLITAIPNTKKQTDEVSDQLVDVKQYLVKSLTHTSPLLFKSLESPIVLENWETGLVIH